MASIKERLKCIKQILENELRGKRLKLTKAIYLENYIDDEEWANKKFFIFQDVESEKTFMVRESNLTNVSFKFKKELVYCVESYGRLLLIANNEMICYRVGERRLYAYIFATKQTIRLDTMFRNDIFKITRSGKPIKKPIIVENQKNSLDGVKSKVGKKQAQDTPRA